MVITMKNIVFLCVISCRMVYSYLRFGTTNCLHLQGRRIRQCEGIKQQGHEERSGVCEWANVI
jgi:hypothetical protein